MFRYRVQVEELSNSEDVLQSFAFEVTNHDDLMKILHRVQQGGIIKAEEAASVVIGLKLVMEVILQHRNDPLFMPLEEPLRNFIRTLKSGTAPEASRSTTTT